MPKKTLLSKAGLSVDDAPPAANSGGNNRMMSNNVIFSLLVVIATLETYRTFGPEFSDVTSQIVYVEKRDLSSSLNATTNHAMMTVEDSESGMGPLLPSPSIAAMKAMANNEAHFVDATEVINSVNPDDSTTSSKPAAGTTSTKALPSTSTTVSRADNSFAAHKVTASWKPPNVTIHTKLRNAMESNNPQRNIVFVHVGKCGGVAVRQNVAIQCGEAFPDRDTGKVNRTTNAMRRHKCYQKFPPQQKLANQTKHVAHMWAIRPEQMEQATTFMFTIRNPIDRIISAYRYNHWANCRADMVLPNGKKLGYMQLNYGCHLLKTKRLERGTKRYRIYKHCFPSPGIEDFAQATLGPYVSNDYWITNNFTRPMKRECRKYARDILQAKPKSGVDPHMLYNYAYYATHSMWKYPEKEIFALRTESEYDDMVTLDVAMGGSGKFAHPDHHVSHGSEYYDPSPITTQAYHKLCCVLEAEIDIYFSIFDKAVNLHETDKDAADQSLREKCGLQPDKTWEDWRTGCQQQLQMAREWEQVGNKKQQQVKPQPQQVKPISPTKTLAGQQQQLAKGIRVGQQLPSKTLAGKA